MLTTLDIGFPPKICSHEWLNFGGKRPHTRTANLSHKIKTTADLSHKNQNKTKNFVDNMFSRALSTLVLGLSFISTHGNDNCQSAVDVTTFPFQGKGEIGPATTADFVSPTDNFSNTTCGIATSCPDRYYTLHNTNHRFTEIYQSPS